MPGPWRPQRLLDRINIDSTASILMQAAISLISPCKQHFRTDSRLSGETAPVSHGPGAGALHRPGRFAGASQAVLNEDSMHRFRPAQRAPSAPDTNRKHSASSSRRCHGAKDGATTVRSVEARRDGVTSTAPRMNERRTRVRVCYSDAGAFMSLTGRGFSLRHPRERKLRRSGIPSAPRHGAGANTCRAPASPERPGRVR